MLFLDINNYCSGNTCLKGSSYCRLSTTKTYYGKKQYLALRPEQWNMYGNQLKPQLAWLWPKVRASTHILTEYLNLILIKYNITNIILQ
jgi:hypothetical protein